MQQAGRITMSGRLATRIIRAPRAPLAWRVKNVLRWKYVKGWLAYHVAAPLANRFGVMTAMGRLEAVLIKKDGQRIQYGTLSYRVITDAGVAYLVDDWDAGASDINLMDFHGCGTGAAAEDVTDTALGTESTTALNPDNTRATGSNSQPAANQFQTVGTLTFDGSAAITEHGIFNQSATGGGTLWDRSVFSAINVSSGDSIQFTYTCTVSAGG